MSELIVGIGSLMTIVGFVTVFVKIGIDKGETDHRLKTLETKTDKLEINADLLEKEIHGIQKETSGFMGRVHADISNIKSMLQSIDKKLEKLQDGR